MNLIAGKVVKSTHYFDNQLTNTEKIKLVKALHSEPGNRSEQECNMIEPYIRSMALFKPYAEYDSNDFHSMLQDIKLHKIKKNHRLCNFGENADRIYIIVNGRIALTYPNAAHF